MHIIEFKEYETLINVGEEASWFGFLKGAVTVLDENQLEIATLLLVALSEKGIIQLERNATLLVAIEWGVIGGDLTNWTKFGTVIQK